MIRDGVAYHLTPGAGYADQADFRAIRISDRMSLPLHETLEYAQMPLESGDRIILASDSVWAVCSSEEILTWTQGKEDEEATDYVREQITHKIAEMNEKAIQEKKF